MIKEAIVLTEAGYAVEVLGGWFDPQMKQRDLDLAALLRINFAPVLDLTDGNGVRRLGCRLCNKLGNLAHSELGWENTWQLGYFVSALRRAISHTKADLIIAHSEPALAAISAACLRGRRVGVDMEDWFSEDLLPEARKQRPLKLLRSLEKEILCHAVHSSCPSMAMSEALAAEYGCHPPTVIYNAFEWCERRLLDGKYKDRKNSRLPSVHWYSQTLGQGRGLEDLFAALPHVKHEVEIHLRGNPVRGFEDWLTSRVPDSWRKRIFIHGLVPNGELLSRIAEHDIGFAGEMKYCRNKDLTVSNKILHYLLGGLAIVASDTAGQREVAEQANGAVGLYPSGDSLALAEQLNALIASPDALGGAKAAALKAAESTFCWERKVPTLLGRVEDALRA